jgi:hypothetical protein
LEGAFRPGDYLSFKDFGVVLSELIGFHGFHDKVKGLADINLVQQGAESPKLVGLGNCLRLLTSVQPALSNTSGVRSKL